MQQILVATDGSESAERAVDVAAELAKATGGILHIVYVASDLPEETLHEVRRSPAMEKLIGDAIDQHSKQILIRARERALAKGVKTVQTQQLWGDAAQNILDASQSVGANMLVVGRRGRGRLAALLLGSVSQKVASLSPSVVVVVP
ncbi:universal stress protein [Hyphomicrobium sp. B1]|uniref:universal stress protein n=1 Tax=unclassified Hyphomicrobium TaxID=2619925 RepID=UPI0039C4A72A